MKDEKPEVKDGKVVITYKKLLELNSGIYQIPSDKKDKLSLAVWQFKEYLKYPLEQYRKEVRKIEEALCSVDSNNDVRLNDKGAFMFNSANLTKRNDKVDELDNKTVEFEIYECLDLTRIKTLHISFLKLFNGYLFNVSDDQLNDWFLETEKKEEDKKKELPVAQN